MDKVTPSNLPRLAHAWAEGYLKERKGLSPGQLSLLVNTIAHDYAQLPDSYKVRVDAVLDGVNAWLADTGRLTPPAGRDEAQEALERLYMAALDRLTEGL